MHAFIHELRFLARLAMPVALTQLGMMMTSVVDTMMVGRISVEALSALALGHMYSWACTMWGMGLIMGADPLISQAHGRGDGAGVALAAQRSFVVMVLVSMPLCALQFWTEEALLLLGQPPRAAALAQTYNVWKLPSLPLFLLFTVMRQYLQGRAIMAPATWVMVFGNVFNALANWVLIFGHLGVPALGMRGAAIATALTGVFDVVVLYAFIHTWKLAEGATRPWDAASWAPSGLRQVAALGLPIAVQMALENGAFSGAAILAGWIGVAEVSGHHLTLNLAAMAFMMPLGISIGAATRVGNLIGAGDEAGMRRALLGSVMLGGGVMAVSALLFLTFREALPRLYTDDAVVVAMVSSTIPIVATFQLADGLQVVACAILRGMGRPRVGALVNLLGYYAFGFPLAYYLTFTLGWGLRGIWSALAASVCLVAVVLLVWTQRTAARGIGELRVQAA